MRLWNASGTWGVWTGNDVHFAQTQSQYTAVSLPEYIAKYKRMVQSDVAGLAEAGYAVVCTTKKYGGKQG